MYGTKSEEILLVWRLLDSPKERQSLQLAGEVLLETPRRDYITSSRLVRSYTTYSEVFNDFIADSLLQMIWAGR